jgi:uncharacterized metal-binding protein YceD (DUF177 family)
MEPEFSRPVEIDKIGREGTVEEIEAEPAELAALARRMKLPAIRSLKARFELTPWKKGRIRVRGEFIAEVEQECVRTLDIFTATVTEPVERIYMKPEAAATRGIATAEGLEDPFADDAPDIIAGDVIDIGELAAESLALALDPWPRKPGTDFITYSTERGGFVAGPEDLPVTEIPAEEERPSPFAGLAALKDRLRSK